MSRLAVVVSFAALLPFAASAGAHGTYWELRLLQPVGPYDVAVMTAPQAPRPGSLHVAIQLVHRETLAYVERVSVSAVARLRGEGEQAGPAGSRYLYPWHELDIALPKAGSWEIELDINVEGARLRHTTTFCADVLAE